MTSESHAKELNFYKEDVKMLRQENAELRQKTRELEQEVFDVKINRNINQIPSERVSESISEFENQKAEIREELFRLKERQQELEIREETLRKEKFQFEIE